MYPYPGPNIVYVRYQEDRKKYGFFKFLGDVFMTLLTYGFWLIWIFVREMRNRRTAI